MTLGEVLIAFCEILVNGISTVAMGVATGVKDMAVALFLDVSSTGAITGLSMFGGIIAIFGGITLAVKLSHRVYIWVSTLGH